MNEEEKGFSGDRCYNRAEKEAANCWERHCKWLGTALQMGEEKKEGEERRRSAIVSDGLVIDCKSIANSVTVLLQIGRQVFTLPIIAISRNIIAIL
ncbi:hypothetical protein JCGZ_10445 [Jatropha curcas]|uniref:Uncharacterized protein n=1 Tax=Jatropha curcas TaxID=180498 RepID=A0A067KUC0_JATCU|nr:hypothetical protein JCGZ_10445 [Jatropha curcas]